jgi:nucleotide-binding universal stress UspA family protein
MKILVPVDYSDHSRRVVETAARLGPPGETEIVIAHVWETQPQIPAHLKVTTPEGRTCSIAELLHEEADGAMNTFMASLPEPGSVKRARCLLSGSAPEAIVDEAVRGKYDLIAMGTHGRTGLGRLFLGSVAEKVLRASPIPVLTVPVPRA